MPAPVIPPPTMIKSQGSFWLALRASQVACRELEDSDTCCMACLLVIRQQGLGIHQPLRVELPAQSADRPDAQLAFLGRQIRCVVFTDAVLMTDGAPI